MWYVKYDILLKDVGVEGQEKIRQGKVLIIGAGGLGAPVALYLAAAGVGTIGISPSYLRSYDGVLCLKSLNNVGYMEKNPIKFGGL